MADPPLVAYAAAAMTNPRLPTELSAPSNVDFIAVEKFFAALKTELKKYSPQIVEKEIDKCRRSIRSRTNIRNLGAYLAKVKTDILTKLARSSNKKGEVAVMPVKDEKQGNSFAPEVMEITEDERKKRIEETRKKIRDEYGFEFGVRCES